MTTYCVWARVPSPGKSMECWSRVTGELTQDAAELFSSQMYFESRAMPDQEAPNTSSD